MYVSITGVIVYLMLYQMYQVLSAEQYVKLFAYWEQIRTGRGGSSK